MFFLPQGLPQINEKTLDCVQHLSAHGDTLQQVSCFSPNPKTILRSLSIPIYRYLICLLHKSFCNCFITSKLLYSCV